MADKSSAYITAKNTGDSVTIDGYTAGQRKFEQVGYIATAADEASGSELRFCRVPSNARISSLKLSTGVNAATTGQFDIGVYRTPENGGTVVSPTTDGVGTGASRIDFFGDAINLDDTAHDNGANDVEVAFQAADYTIDLREKPLWEALGYDEDPKQDFDIVLTLTEIFAGGPTAMGLKVEYSI